MPDPVSYKGPFYLTEDDQIGYRNRSGQFVVIGTLGPIDADNITSGTLDPARLPASVPLLDGDDLDIAGTITTGQFTVADTIYDGQQGTTVYDAGNGGNLFAQGYITWDGGQSGSDGAGNVYIGNSIYLGDSVSGAGINGPSGAYFRDNGEQGWITGGTIQAGAFSGDASDLYNVPTPAGLRINDAGTSTADNSEIITNYDSFGDMWVGTGSGSGGLTQLLSGPETLGPLDGSALTYYGGQDLGSVMSGLTVGEAEYASNDFNAFFHNNDYNTDISLPGDGTASFSNGQFQIGSDGGFGVNCAVYPDGFFQVNPNNRQILIGDYNGDSNGTSIVLDDNTETVTITGSLAVTNGINLNVGSAAINIAGTPYYPHVTAGALTFTSTP